MFDHQAEADIPLFKVYNYLSLSQANCLDLSIVAVIVDNSHLWLWTRYWSMNHCASNILVVSGAVTVNIIQFVDLYPIISVLGLDRNCQIL